MAGDEKRTMSLLLVDDEPALRNALARSLGARGFTVHSEGSYRGAIEAACNAAFDVLVLDINLPDASGWDVLRELKAIGRTLPTIVFSAVPPNAERVREFQPRGVLVKPFPIDALVRLVSQVEQEKTGE